MSFLCRTKKVCKYNVETLRRRPHTYKGVYSYSSSRAHAHPIFFSIFNITISHALTISELSCDIGDICDVKRSNNCFHWFRWEIRVERTAPWGVFQALERFVPCGGTSRSMRGNVPKGAFGRSFMCLRTKLHVPFKTGDGKRRSSFVP